MMSHRKQKHAFSSQKQRRRAPYGGQTVPASTSGIGKQVLYRCPICQRPWLQDGSRTYLRLEPEQLIALLPALSADLAALPLFTCRLCLFTAGSGVFEIDEYGAGKGYGINWEAALPVEAHLQASILAQSWALQQTTSPTSDVIRQPERARAVLHWLSQIEALACVHILDEQEEAYLRRDNLPGNGRTGTEGWVWKGALFFAHCPPLADIASLVLAIAQPASVPLDVAALVATWKDLAARALEGRLAGETGENA